MTLNEGYGLPLRAAIEAANAARAILLAECTRTGGPRGRGGHADVDTVAERVLKAILRQACPRGGYHGEELPGESPHDGDTHYWVVDPNDGTASMLEGFRGHAVSIAAVVDGRPVLGVVQAVDAPDDAGDCFAWAEGCGPLIRNGVAVMRAPWPATLSARETVLVSQKADWAPEANLRCVAPARFHTVASIAYRLALVAAGEGVAGVSLAGPGAWDYAAGHALLRAATPTCERDTKAVQK